MTLHVAIPMLKRAPRLRMLACEIIQALARNEVHNRGVIRSIDIHFQRPSDVGKAVIGEESATHHTATANSESARA